MSNLVLMQDDRISIPTTLMKTNELPTRIAVDTLMLPAGLVIPLEWNYGSVVDYLEGNYNTEWQARSVPALLVTPSGKLYEFFIAESREPLGNEDCIYPITARRLLHGKGTRYARAQDIKHEEIGTMALHLTGDIDKAFALAKKVETRLQWSYEVWSIEEITKALHAKGYTEDKPWGRMFKQ
jgi:hypothetical protein